MIRDVATRWSSTSELVQRGLDLLQALKILCVKAEYNKVGRGVRLACFQLSAEEWKLLEDLSPLLDVSCYSFVLFTHLMIAFRFFFLLPMKSQQTRFHLSIKSFRFLMLSQQSSKTTSRTMPFPSLSVMLRYGDTTCSTSTTPSLVILLFIELQWVWLWHYCRNSFYWFFSL